MSLHHIVIDAHDLSALARFWAQVMGWRILSDRDREVVIGAEESAPVGICFMPVTDRKVVKNRLHLDLTCDPDTRDAEIERILQLGARDERWPTGHGRSTDRRHGAARSSHSVPPAPRQAVVGVDARATPGLFCCWSSGRLVEICGSSVSSWPLVAALFAPHRLTAIAG